MHPIRLQRRLGSFGLFKMHVKFALLAFITFVVVANGKLRPSIKIFRGRPLDGFVRKPPIEYVAKSLATNGVTSGWFTQKLDHFDSTISATWQQQYQVNNQYFKAGSPMFVMISGEAPMSISWMTYGQWYKNAGIYGALMLQLEHRFYGSSHPTSDCSTANLKYLTSEQALADLDNFITSMKTQYNIDKVIVFGGSYAGDLTAFYKEKYPTAIGAVSSSGPVTAEVDFTQYLETVGYTMDYFNPGCSAQVQEGFASLQSIITSQDTSTLNSLFPPCGSALNYNDPYDISSFFESLINPWEGAVQYTAPDAATSAVAEMCRTVMNPEYGSDPLHRLSYYYKETQSCIYHSYEGQISALKETSWNAAWVESGTRQWTWQTCNEFGFYQSTDSQNQPFGQTVPVSFMEDTSCTRVFGQSDSQIDANADNTNNYYGGTTGDVFDIKYKLKFQNLEEQAFQETNTYFVNGSLDPWHNLGIYQVSPADSDTVAFINGTSHCYDMDNDQPTDPPQLTAVRAAITQQIGQWLS